MRRFEPFRPSAPFDKARFPPTRLSNVQVADALLNSEDMNERDYASGKQEQNCHYEIVILPFRLVGTFAAFYELITLKYILTTGQLYWLHRH